MGSNSVVMTDEADEPGIEEYFFTLMRALDDHKVDYVLVGGMAVNLLGLVRATEDIDLFLSPTPDNIERLRHALRQVWDDPCIDEISAEDLCGDYPVVRYGPPVGAFVVDLMTRLGESFAFSDLEGTTIELESTQIRVATPETLYRMKRDTVRPRDQIDALALKKKFHLEEE